MDVFSSDTNLSALNGSAEITRNNAGKSSQWRENISPLWSIGAPIILLLGITGNALAMTIVCKMDKFVTYYLYIFALCASNLMVQLTGLLPEWCRWQFGTNIEDINIATCKLSRFIRYSFGMLSSFLIVAVTCYRAVAIALPHRARDSRRKTRRIIASIVLSAFTINSYMPFTFEHTKVNCRYKAQYNKYDAYVRIVNATLFSFLPFGILLSSNYILIREVLLSARRTRHKNSRKSKVTIQVLAISTTFLLLKMPSSIIRIVRIAHPQLDSQDYFKYLHQAFVFLFYMNSVVDCYLYALSGSNFRRKAKTLFWRASGIFVSCLRHMRSRSIDTETNKMKETKNEQPADAEFSCTANRFRNNTVESADDYQDSVTTRCSAISRQDCPRWSD